MTQMRHRTEDVKRVIAFGRDGGIGHTRAMDIQAHVIGQLALDEDVIHQTLVARRVQDRVVADICPFGLGTLGPEVPDIQAHRPSGCLQLLVGPAFCRVVAQQARMGMSCIGVGNDDIRVDPLPSGQTNAHGTTVFDQDLVHLGLVAQQTVLFFDDAGHRFGNRRHTAHRVVNPELLFQMADKDIHRSHIERVATDEQRMEREGHSQPLVLEPLCRMGIDGTVGAHPHEGGQHFQQVGKFVHRPATKILEPEPVAVFAVFQELVIARQITGREPPHLGAHCIGVLPRRETGPVGPADLVKRVHRAQVHILVEFATTDSP